MPSMTISRKEAKILKVLCNKSLEGLGNMRVPKVIITNFKNLERRMNVHRGGKFTLSRSEKDTLDKGLQGTVVALKQSSQQGFILKRWFVRRFRRTCVSLAERVSRAV